jgi:hypothetical protein
MPEQTKAMVETHKKVLKMCSVLAGEGIGQGVLELARLRSTSKARRKLIRKRLFVAVLLTKRRVIEVYGEVEV